MAKFRLRSGFGEHYRFNGVDLVQVKPGDVIECPEEELSAVLDKFEVVEADKPKKPESAFRIEKIAGGYFNVIHPVTGKLINSKSLRKEDAEELAGKTVEEYDAEQVAAEEAAKKEQDDKKQALIEKIMAGEGCPFTLEVLMAKSLAELEQVEDSEDDRLAALANTKSGGAGSGK